MGGTLIRKIQQAIAQRVLLRPGRKQQHGSLARTLTVEILEGRRMLTSFTRVDPDLNPDTKDLYAESDVTMQAYDYTQSPYEVGASDSEPPEFEDVLAHSAAGNNAVVGDGRGSGIAQSTADTLTATGDTTGTPTVNAVAQQLVSTAGRGEDYTRIAGGRASAIAVSGFAADFVYSDDTPLVADYFLGGIYLVGVGGGVQGETDTSYWSGGGTMDLTIVRNDIEVLANIHVEGGGNGGKFDDVEPYYVPDHTFWTANVAVTGQAPFTISGTQLNAFITFSTTISDGDKISFIGGIDASAHAAELPYYGEPVTQAVFGEVLGAFCHGFENAGDVPPTGTSTTPPNIGGGFFFPDPGVLGPPQDFLFVTSDAGESNSDTSFFDLSLPEALALAGDVNHPGAQNIVIAPWIHNIDLDGSPLVIDSDVNLIGPGADNLTIDAGGLSGVFETSGDNVVLSGLTITGGNSSDGGAVTASGGLTVSNSKITGNSGAGAGGIFMNDYAWQLKIENTAIENNTGGSTGGVRTSGTTTEIRNSTISGNTGDDVGGLNFYGLFNPLTLVNSTISGNTGDDVGGVFIDEYGCPTAIINCTIAKNTGAVGGLKVVADSSPYEQGLLANCIIAGNLTLLSAPSDVSLYLPTLNWDSSHNLIGYDHTTSDLMGLDNGVNGNFVGGEGSNPAIDARFANLADNGGSTKTHALYSDSLAIDAGDDAIAEYYDLVYDQRGTGHDRIIDGGNGLHVDIGAFEFDSV